MTAPDTRKLFGPLLLILVLAVALISLADLGVYLTWGIEATLSQNIANATTMDAALAEFIGSSCFACGMLATHFTDFRMRRQKDERPETMG